MTPEARKGRSWQKVWLAEDGRRKISNLSPRREAHLLDLPWQLLRKKWRQSQYRHDADSRALDNIKAIALVADSAVLESVTRFDTSAATGPMRPVVSAPGVDDATCVSARLSPVCSNSTDLTLGERGSNCVSRGRCRKNDKARCLGGGQTLVKMEAVVLAAWPEVKLVFG